MIDVGKYFKPLPKEGDYEFQEHLTDHLLEDILLANETEQTLRNDCMDTKRALYKLTEELKEVSQVRKDLPDIQQPYIILYRKLKHELCEAESKLLQIEEHLNQICDGNTSLYNSKQLRQDIMKLIHPSKLDEIVKISQELGLYE